MGKDSDGIGLSTSQNMQGSETTTDTSGGRSAFSFSDKHDFPHQYGMMAGVNVNTAPQSQMFMIDETEKPTEVVYSPLKTAKVKEADSITLPPVPTNPGEWQMWETTVSKEVVAAAADTDGAAAWSLEIRKATGWTMLKDSHDYRSLSMKLFAAISKTAQGEFKCHMTVSKPSAYRSRVSYLAAE